MVRHGKLKGKNALTALSRRTSRTASRTLCGTSQRPSAGRSQPETIFLKGKKSMLFGDLILLPNKFNGGCGEIMSLETAKKSPVFFSSDDRGGPIVIGDREKDDESLFIAPLAQ